METLNFESRRLQELNRLTMQMAIIENEIFEILIDSFNRRKLIELQEQYFDLKFRRKLILDHNYSKLHYPI